ncbi:MAG: hypothetical protein GF411_17925 [Candidatus Lokiarchaeota archaeon]|nr:hypothetical protein [Candidatus Lokiarchaeota archaeon]
MKRYKSTFEKLIRLRRYGEIEALCDRLIQNEGWNAIRSLFADLPVMDHAPKGFTMIDKEKAYIAKAILQDRDKLYHVRGGEFVLGIPLGKMRDALVKLYRIESIKGIDTPLLELSLDLNPDNLEELRTQIIPICIEHLLDQIKTKNTFFLDFEEIASSLYASIIPNLIDARKQEIEALEGDNDINELLQTYYGFEVIIRGTIPRYNREIPKGLKQKTDSLFRLMKVKGTITSEDLLPRTSLFQHCSKYSAFLLNQIVEISIRSKRKRANSLRTLGYLGDSRAIPYIMHMFNSYNTSSEHKHKALIRTVIETLGNIGCVESLRVLREHIDKIHPNTRKAFAKMAFSDPEEVKSLLETIYKMGRKQASIIIEELWRLEDSSVIPILEWALKKRDVRSFCAIRALKLSGVQGKQVLLDQGEHIPELMLERKYLRELSSSRIGWDLFQSPGFFRGMMELLEYPEKVIKVPNEVWRRSRPEWKEEFAKPLAQAIRRADKIFIQLVLSIPEGYFQYQDLQDAMNESREKLITHMKDERSLRGTLRHIGYGKAVDICIRYPEIAQDEEIAKLVLQTFAKEFERPISVREERIEKIRQNKWLRQSPYFELIVEKTKK